MGGKFIPFLPEGAADLGGSKDTRQQTRITRRTTHQTTHLCRDLASVRHRAGEERQASEGRSWQTR